MTPTENEQIREALRALSLDRRNDDAWRAIIKQTYPIARATANRILHGARDFAEDAAWEAFARIARYADFQLLALMEPGAFLLYLKQVTRRTSYDFLRSLGRHSPEIQFLLGPLSVDFDGSAPTPEEALAANELHREIRKALDPEEQRLLVLVMEGFTIGEISDRLHISYEATGVRKHRMREKIRKYLTEREL